MYGKNVSCNVNDTGILDSRICSIIVKLCTENENTKSPQNTRYKSKCSQCCTRVSLHFKITLGLNSACDKITSFTLLLFMIQYFTIKPWAFSHTVYPGKQLQWKSSCRDTQVPLLQFWNGIHESTISMRFLGIILRFSDFYLCFCLSTKCYSWKNLSFLDCFVWNSETIWVI